MYDTPITENKPFKMIYRFKSLIDLPIDELWFKISTDDEILKWDSTVEKIDSDFRNGGEIKMFTKYMPGKELKLKVESYHPPHKMIWSSGFFPLFKGTRTFNLESRNKKTILELTEVFQGLFLPLIKPKLPSCKSMFGTYFCDLRRSIK